MMGKYTSQQRYEIIQIYYRNAKSVASTLRALCPIYGRYNRPSRSTIERLVQKFESTGSVQNVPVPVRQRSARSVENIAAAEASVDESPNVSLTHRSKALGISVTSLWRILRKDLESDVSVTSPPLASVTAKWQDKETDSLHNEEEITTKRKVHGRKPIKKRAAVAEDADEDDEPLKKKKLDVVETAATVVTPQRSTARRGGARNAAATVTAPKDAVEEAADELDVEEEKPKATHSRAARAPKAKDVPHVREHRIASTSTLDGHSDDEPEDEKPSTSVATATKRNAAAIETQASTDSPAPNRSRRKPVAAAAASEDVAVTDDEDVAEVVTEAPKRATHNTHRK